MNNPPNITLYSKKYLANKRGQKNFQDLILFRIRKMFFRIVANAYSLVYITQLWALSSSSAEPMGN